SPTLGRFDSGAAPLSRNPRQQRSSGPSPGPGWRPATAHRRASGPPEIPADRRATGARLELALRRDWAAKSALARLARREARSAFLVSRGCRPRLVAVTVCPSCGQENPEGFRFCGACGGPLRVAAPAGVRKTVTVLFCDVTGSTALGESVDPEALRGLLARYFERMKGIVEFHGGTVEKFIGDAVMAVFGVPEAHEDDALRACRAAVEMREAVPDLGIEGRIGVNTGEVVAGTEERLATGDAVNVAARLQQAAEPGETLLAETTLRLARAAVEAESVEPLSLKGKREPLPAWRLVAVSTAALERRFDSLL